MNTEEALAQAKKHITDRSEAEAIMHPTSTAPQVIQHDLWSVDELNELVPHPTASMLDLRAKELERANEILGVKAFRAYSVFEMVRMGFVNGMPFGVLCDDFKLGVEPAVLGKAGRKLGWQLQRVQKSRTRAEDVKQIRDELANDLTLGRLMHLKREFETITSQELPTTPRAWESFARAMKMIEDRMDGVGLNTLKEKDGLHLHGNLNIILGLAEDIDAVLDRAGIVDAEVVADPVRKTLAAEKLARVEDTPSAGT